MSRIDTLINFSGGIDSTHVLYHWLKSNPNKRCLVHHIHIINRENRHIKEAESVKNILAWLENQGLDNFEYIETTFDYKATKGLFLDGFVISMMTQLISQGHPNIKYTFFCTPKDEKERLGYRLHSRRERYNRLKSAISIGYKLEAKEVLIHLSKKEIMEQLPSELLNLTWYCRKPTPTGDTCKKCHTCKQVARSRSH